MSELNTDVKPEIAPRLMESIMEIRVLVRTRRQKKKPRPVIQSHNGSIDGCK